MTKTNKLWLALWLLTAILGTASVLLGSTNYPALKAGFACYAWGSAASMYIGGGPESAAFRPARTGLVGNALAAAVLEMLGMGSAIGTAMCGCLWGIYGCHLVLKGGK